MTGPFLTNILTSLIAGGVALFAGVLLFKKSKREKEMAAFSLFWIFLGAAVFLLGLRTVFAGIGFLDVDRILFHFTQSIGMLSFAPGFYYVFYRVFLKRKVAEISGIIGLILTFLYFFFHFRGQIEGPIFSLWGTEYVPPPAASFFLLAGIAPIILLATYDVVFQIMKKAAKKVFDSEKFIPSFLLMIYVFVMIFEGPGETTGVFLVLQRMVLMICSLAFLYILASGKEG